MIESRFDEVFNAWIFLETTMPYVIDRYSSAYLNLLSDEPENNRIAFVDLCSSLDSYFQKEIKSAKTDFKKVIKILIEQIGYPKIKKCYGKDFHLNIANTRHSFMHDFDKGDDRNRFVLESNQIKRHAGKLKALFEYLILKRHFKFSDKEIYECIANPWPNTIYLNELY